LTSPFLARPVPVLVPQQISCGVVLADVGAEVVPAPNPTTDVDVPGIVWKNRADVVRGAGTILLDPLKVSRHVVLGEESIVTTCALTGEDAGGVSTEVGIARQVNGNGSSSLFARRSQTLCPNHIRFA
jgi:hypothetical protein